MTRHQCLLFMLGCHLLGTSLVADTVTWDDVIRSALVSDERIEIQRRNVVIAGQEVSRAWTIVSPRLTASAQYDRPEEELRRDGQVIVPEDSWRATITARQPVFDGRVLPARRWGLALEAAEAHALVHTIQQSLFDVSRIFYGVLSAQKQVQIAEQTVDLAREEVARARARFDAGEARRTEVLRAEVDEARSARNLVLARNAFALSRSELARRVGWPTNRAFTLQAPEPGPEQEEAASVADLLEEALRQRHDVAALRRQVQAGWEEDTVIRREAWPTLELQFNHRFVDPESFSNRNNTWDIAAVARYEFWDGGSRRVSRRQQTERIQQAELRVDELEKNIELEIHQAWLDIHMLRENIASLRKEVTLAEENYRTLSEQARVGLATSLDVSTALTALDQARTDLSREAFDLAVARQRLEATVGAFARDYIDMEGADVRYDDE